MMAGWYRMHRGWMEHELFGDEPFSRAQAWAWLIETASWKDTTILRNKGGRIALQRGQLHTSLRALGDAWHWSKGKVERFLADLETAHMLTHNTGQFGATLTICNYDKYQDADERGGTIGGTVSEPQDGTTAGQPRDTIEEGKEYTHTPARAREGARYAFEGKVIRLNQADFDRWRTTYTGIPDLRAELLAIDAHLAAPDYPADKRKRWFHSVPGMLNRSHQQAKAAPAGGRPATGRPAAGASGEVKTDVNGFIARMRAQGITAPPQLKLVS